tara:strand:- start:688 stop:1227 length:540 start_codon:yes stop_codon:yes gene_type:complete
MNNLIQFLTYFRIFIGLFIFLLVSFYDSYGWALILFLLASVSDFWDGFLARKYNLESELGEVLDPIADKILITFILIALTLHLDSIFLGFTTVMILAREFWVSALRHHNARRANNEATKVTFLAKLKTTTQFSAISLYLLSLFLGSALLLFVSDLIIFLSLIISIKTGLSYTLETFKKQ